MNVFELVNGKLYQWDTNRKIQILPQNDEQIDEVHFAHAFDEKALPVRVKGDGTADIPNILLQTDGALCVWAVALNDDGRQTLHNATFTIRGRAKPDDYVYTETEVKTYEGLAERIKALEKNGVGGGGGAVESVNGKTGAVTLKAEDIGAIPNEDGAIQSNHLGSQVVKNANIAYGAVSDSRIAEKTITFQRLSDACVEDVTKLQYIAQQVEDELRKIARDNIAAASQKDVERLTEEVGDIRAELMNEATANGNTVRIEPESGSALKVVSTIATDGEGVAQVNLTHSGKNIARLRTVTSNNGYTCANIGLSEISIEGTGTGSKYIDIVPHVMRATQEVITVTMPNDMTFEFSKNGVWTGYVNNGQSLMINGNVGDRITGYFMAAAGKTVSGNVTVQIEIGALGTEYEAATETVYTVDLQQPVANGDYNWQTGVLTNADTGENVEVSAQSIAAYDGVNVLWSDTGATTVTYKRTGTGGGNGVTVTEKPFDCTVFNLPTLDMNGDTTEMNKDNAVALATDFKGVAGEDEADTKWQGSSSLAYPEKNYTIKFKTAFEAKEGWGSQKKYVAKADWIDAGHFRNNWGAYMWGQICASRGDDPLADCPNYGAIDGFPICVRINDEFMGVYNFNIPKDGWMANMPSEGATQEAIVCADVTGIDATRFKGAADLDGSDFEIEYITDENSTEWAKTSLNALITACVNSDGRDLDTTIAPMLHWNRAIDYYIFTVLIRGDDMIDKNYLLIKRENKPWLFGGYDMDCILGLYWDGSKWLEANKWTTFSDVASKHRVMWLIYTHKRAELIARYEQLRSTIMSEDNVAMTLLNYAGQIPLALRNEDSRRWPTKPNTSVNNVQQAIDWYRRRCIVIDKEIEALKS